MRKWLGLSTCIGIAVAAWSCTEEPTANPTNPDAGGRPGDASADVANRPDTGTPIPDSGEPVPDAGSDARADGSTTDGGAYKTITLNGPETVHVAPIGFTGITNPVVLVCGAGGCAVFDLVTGLRRGSNVDTQVRLGGVTYQQQRALDGGTVDDVVAYFAASGGAVTSWNQSDWGLTQLDPPCQGCTPEVTDMVAAPAAAPPDGTSLMVDKGRAQVSYSRYDRDAGQVLYSSTQKTHLKVTDGGAAYVPVTAFQRAGNQPGLVVGVPAPDAGAPIGHIFVHNRTSAAATPITAAGDTPRFVRCAEQVCVLTNGGSNNVTTFTWDGVTAVGAINTHAVGTSPLGVDVKKSGADYVAVVVNSGANSYNVVRLNAAGGLVSNATVALTGCTSPRHVSFIPGTDSFALSCKNENKVIVLSL